MDDKVTEKERYEIIHKMSRRVASVDKYCVVRVECLSLLMHGERKDIIIFLYISSAVLAMNI